MHESQKKFALFDSSRSNDWAFAVAQAVLIKPMGFLSPESRLAALQNAVLTKVKVNNPRFTFWCQNSNIS